MFCLFLYSPQLLLSVKGILVLQPSRFIHVYPLVGVLSYPPHTPRTPMVGYLPAPASQSRFPRMHVAILQHIQDLILGLRRPQHPPSPGCGSDSSKQEAAYLGPRQKLAIAGRRTQSSVEAQRELSTARRSPPGKPPAGHRLGTEQIQSRLSPCRHLASVRPDCVTQGLDARKLSSPCDPWKLPQHSISSPWHPLVIGFQPLNGRAEELLCIFKTALNFNCVGKGLGPEVLPELIQISQVQEQHLARF